MGITDDFQFPGDYTNNDRFNLIDTESSSSSSDLALNQFVMEGEFFESGDFAESDFKELLNQFDDVTFSLDSSDFDMNFDDVPGLSDFDDRDRENMTLSGNGNLGSDQTNSLSLSLDSILNGDENIDDSFESFSEKSLNHLNSDFEARLKITNPTIENAGIIDKYGVFKRIIDLEPSKIDKESVVVFVLDKGKKRVLVDCGSEGKAKAMNARKQIVEIDGEKYLVQGVTSKSQEAVDFRKKLEEEVDRYIVQTTNRERKEEDHLHTDEMIIHHDEIHEDSQVRKPAGRLNGHRLESTVLVVGFTAEALKKCLKKLQRLFEAKRAETEYREEKRTTSFRDNSDKIKERILHKEILRKEIDEASAS